MASNLKHLMAITPVAGNAALGRSRPVVAPFARALSLLAAFGTDARWLGNTDLSVRTGLPASTVTRMAHSLVHLGYLHYAPERRKFCLAPAVLALGYGAVEDHHLSPAQLQQMQHFAEQHGVHVHLSTRDRLDLVVIEGRETPALPAALQLGVGARLDLASSPAGWALLASLPEIERHYLLQSAQQRPQRDWQWLRKRSSEAMGQIRQNGFCMSPADAGQALTMVSSPLRLQGRAPLAMSCMAPSRLMSRSRSQRELGPALACMVQDLASSATV